MIPTPFVFILHNLYREHPNSFTMPKSLQECCAHELDQCNDLTGGKMGYCDGYDSCLEGWHADCPSSDQVCTSKVNHGSYCMDNGTCHGPLVIPCDQEKFCDNFAETDPAAAAMCENVMPKRAEFEEPRLKLKQVR